MARAAAAELRKLACLGHGREFRAQRPRLRDAALRLGRLRPSMSALPNLMRGAAELLAQVGDRAAFVRRLDALVERTRRAEHGLASAVAEKLPQGAVVMTISYSGTVRRALAAAASQLSRVFVCEGRPLCEGRQLAAALANAGVPVTLITDAQADLWMSNCSLVLLGADSAVPGKGAVNKVGSAFLAMSAARHNVPVWVAAESLKLVRGEPSAVPELERCSASEVWNDPPSGVEVRNVYFELVPWELIAQFIQEP